MSVYRTLVFSLLLAVFAACLSAQESQENDSARNKIKSFDFALRLDYMFTSGYVDYSGVISEVSYTFPEEGDQVATLSPTFSAGIEIGRNHFFLGFNDVSLDIDGALENSIHIEYEDSTLLYIPAGTRVRSEIDMNIISLSWARTIIESQQHEFGMGAGLMLIDYGSNYTLEGFVESNSFDQVYPAPMLSFHYSMDLERVEFVALVGGVGIKLKDKAIAYSNMDISARYKLFRRNNWLGMLSFGVKFVPFYTSFSSDLIYFENKMNLLGPFVGFRFKRVLSHP